MAFYSKGKATMEDLFSPEFWALVSAKQRQEQRYGQAVANTAFYFFPEFTRQLDGSIYDPFYDDNRVPAFLERLADHITR